MVANDELILIGMKIQMLAREKGPKKFFEKLYENLTCVSYRILS